MQSNLGGRQTTGPGGASFIAFKPVSSHCTSRHASFPPQVAPATGSAGEGDFQRLGLAMGAPLGRTAEFLSDALDDVQVRLVIGLGR